MDAKPSWFAVGYGAFLLALGGLLTWLVEGAESSDVLVAMPTWAALLHAAFGPWGIFGLFAVVGGFVLLGGVLSFTVLLPRPIRVGLDRLLEGIIAVTITLGFMVGGGGGGYWLWQSGHWVYGCLLALVAIAGVVFSLGMLGLGKIGAVLATWTLALAVSVGIPVVAGAWAHQTYGEGDDRWILGAVVAVLFVVLDGLLLWSFAVHGASGDAAVD